METEYKAKQNAHWALNAVAIKSQLIGKTFLGSFPPSFKYIISIKEDGTLEGKNNYQHYDSGKWVLDTNNNTFSVSWDFGWENTTNNVYLVDGVVKMFDSTSGKLNTSFDQEIMGIESIQTFDI